MSDLTHPRRDFIITGAAEPEVIGRKAEEEAAEE